jgi:hypothetical protein
MAEVSNEELRQKFNHDGYAQSAIDNHYTCCLKDRYPILINNEPADSVILGYRDQNEQIRFLVHAYIRVDGTIAGTGLLDPKLIVDRQMQCFRNKPST